MTREELEMELDKVRQRLLDLEVGSRAWVAGKEIEKAILHSLGVGE
jgi:hypothetical protein